MSRTSLNAAIDTAALIEAMGLTSTGLLIWLRLPPGSGRAATVWSLDRHGWGEVHFWIAMAAIATLLVHLALHWKWIVSVASGKPRGARRKRRLIAAGVLTALVAMALAPVVSPVETAAYVPHESHDEDHREGGALHDAAIKHRDATITGRMSLAEAAAVSGTSVEELRDLLGLPDQTDPASRLGPLARELCVEMQTLRERIEQTREALHPLDGLNAQQP